MSTATSTPPAFSDEVPATPESSKRQFALSPRSIFWLTFVLMFILTSLWSIAGPLMSSPDEPAHAIKAAAVVRGELLGDETGQPVGKGVVQVPELFSQVQTLPDCFAKDTTKTALCQPELTGDLGATATAATSAVRYNPVYYVFVGLPSLFGSTELTLYLMRLVSALLAAIMIALALRSVTELGRSHWMMIATMVALTPMVVFLSGSINPQSVELSAALLVWVTMLALLRDPSPELLTRRMFRITLGCLFFANSRGLGPLFLAITLAAVILCSPLRNLLVVIKDRRSWPYLGLCVAFVAIALVWIVAAGTITTTEVVAHPELTGRSIIWRTLDSTGDFLRQSIGVFGWLDAQMPDWTYLVGAGLVLFIIIVGFGVGRWMDRLVMVALGIAVMLVGVVSHYLQARYIGVFWQGRYSLPIAFGVPLIAGFAAMTVGRQIPNWINRRILLAVLAGVCALQTFALIVNLRRYLNSAFGGWFRTDARSWVPPVSPYLLVGVCLAGWLLLAGVLLLGAEYRRPMPPVATAEPEGDFGFFAPGTYPVVATTGQDTAILEPTTTVIEADQPARDDSVSAVSLVKDSQHPANPQHSDDHPGQRSD